MSENEENQRKRLIHVVAGAIWEHGLRKSGTATNFVDISESSLAAAIVDRFTCPECKFIDMFEGNLVDGVCNDCTPRVTARYRADEKRRREAAHAAHGGTAPS